MISYKSQMLISLAVSDYMKMFPEEYDKVLKSIKRQKQNLKTDLAEIKEMKGIKRALFTIPETLHDMIVSKLENAELTLFKELDSSRWFAKKFSQFSITKQI